MPPFIILIGRDYFAAPGSKTFIVKKTVWLSSGFSHPRYIIFYLSRAHAALDDFFYQNEMMIQVMGRVGDTNTYLAFLGSVLQILRTLASDFRGRLFTLILIVLSFDHHPGIDVEIIR